jgi:uncharacterized iron-regulated membrane protein
MGKLEFRGREDVGPAPAVKPDIATPDRSPAPAPARRRRRRLRPVVQRLHRWISFAAGLILLVVVLSGAALVLDPEIHRWLNADLYQSTETADPIGPQRALNAVERELPDHESADVAWERGIWKVYDADYIHAAHVDPGTGEVLGVSSEAGGVMGFLKNLHMCGLGCKEYPGFVPFLNDRVQVLGNDRHLTVGGLILALSAVILLLLCVSGIVLWWPGRRRLRRGFQVRRANRYKTNYDLHKLVGLAAIPFLALWAISGAGFELKQIGQAWYALLPGSEPGPTPAFASEPKRERAIAPEGRDREITMREAAAIGERAVPDSRLVSVSVPDPQDKASFYSVWVANGSDPYEYSLWPGGVEIRVDRYSGRAKPGYGDPTDDQPVSQTIWEEWNFALHAGVPFNPGWRSAWLVFGLAPLLLAITGITTWLIRRRGRRRKRRAKAGMPAPDAA